MNFYWVDNQWWTLEHPVVSYSNIPNTCQIRQCPIFSFILSLVRDTSPLNISLFPLYQFYIYPAERDVFLCHAVWNDSIVCEFRKKPSSNFIDGFFYNTCCPPTPPPLLLPLLLLSSSCFIIALSRRQTNLIMARRICKRLWIKFKYK